MVFAVVSVGLIWKRLYNRDLPMKQQMFPFSVLMIMVLASIGEATKPIPVHLAAQTTGWGFGLE